LEESYSIFGGENVNPSTCLVKILHQT